MNLEMCMPLALTPRGEGWLWWLGLMGVVLLALLALLTVRRFLIKPMAHKPSDTSDAWAEAGRRLSVPPPKDQEEGPDDENEEGRS